MDTATISSFVDIASKVGLTSSTLATLFIFLYVYKRTKSSHVFLARLWLMLNGKNECKDPVIKKFLDEQSDLLQFRFITGIPAATVAHVGILKIWCDSQGEPLTTVAACGRYFDLNNSCAFANDRLPGKKKVASFGLIVTVLMLLTMFSVVGTTYDRALLRMKNTGTWFGINEDSVKPMSRNPGFLLSECAKGIAQRNHPGFEASDVDFICSWGQQQAAKAYIAKTITGQRWLFAVIAILLGFSALSLWRRLMQASEALALHARIAVRVPS